MQNTKLELEIIITESSTEIPVKITPKISMEQSTGLRLSLQDSTEQCRFVRAKEIHFLVGEGELDHSARYLCPDSANPKVVITVGIIPSSTPEEHKHCIYTCDYDQFKVETGMRVPRVEREKDVVLNNLVDTLCDKTSTIFLRDGVNDSLHCGIIDKTRGLDVEPVKIFEELGDE